MTTQDNSGTHATLADSGANTDSQQLPRGSNLGRYVIIEPIGSGGMGTVYRAYDPQLNRGVALKILSVKHADLGTAERAKARLIREAQALAQLSHPNVVAVHDAGTFEDDVFIAMELVEGKTLGDWLKEEKRAVKEILGVMTAAGRGLSAAHKAGLVHRDFKPGNVIVGDDGRVRVLDFGLARAADHAEVVIDETMVSGPGSKAQDEQSKDPKKPIDWKEISSDSSPNLLQSPLTHDGGVLGTPLYMAPEQHLGKKTDERTDQFGFCVVLYEALYGKRPFAARSMGKLKSEVIRERIRIPNTDTNVPDWLWLIIRKGLNAKPDDRYPNIALLLENLNKDPDEERFHRRTVFKRRLLFFSLVMLAVALPLLVWYDLRYSAVRHCKQNTETEAKKAWDEQLGLKIEEAFLGTRASFAESTLHRVKKNLEKYVTDWTETRSELCESVGMDMQPDDLFHPKMRCLKERLVEFKKLSKIFARADKEVVQKAVQASMNLSSLSRCFDENELNSTLELPNERNKSKVELLRERLQTAKVLQSAGKYSESMLVIQSVLGKAEKLGYQPLLAEVLFVAGDLENENGKYRIAEEQLQRAYWEAVKSDHVEIMIMAANKLIWVVGYQLARVIEGVSWGWIAKTAIARLKWPPRFYGIWHNNMGAVYGTQGDEQRELEHHRKSLQIEQNSQNGEHIAVAHALNNIGVIFWRREDYNQALEYYQKALNIMEEVFGSDHPNVANYLNNIGLVYWKKAAFGKAYEYLHRALVNWENALGHEHPILAWPLFGLGEVHLATGKRKEALLEFVRVTEICKKESCNPEPYGNGLFGLSRALALTNDRINHAIKMARRAREIFRSNPKRFKKELEEVNTWLQKHGEKKIAKKALNDNPR